MGKLDHIFWLIWSLPPTHKASRLRLLRRRLPLGLLLHHLDPVPDNVKVPGDVLQFGSRLLDSDETLLGSEEVALLDHHHAEVVLGLDVAGFDLEDTPKKSKKIYII